MAEPVTQSFKLVTGNEDPEIDVIGVCLEALNQLMPESQRRVLCYLWERRIGPCRTANSADGDG